MNDPRTEESNSGETSDLRKLKSSDLLAVFWEVLKSDSNVFSSKFLKGAPPARMGHEFKIDLEDETPSIHRPLCKLSPLELEESSKKIQDMLVHKLIRPSESPYAIPCYLYLKKDGSLRFYVDYCWMNKHTIEIRYPLL